ncbi:MAG: hypothetical protein WD607_01415 [Candidatus Paceibacterota bacterium]
MPNKNIRRLSLHSLDPRRKYFLDANIWITYLTNPQYPKAKEEVYMQFFEKLIETQLLIFSHSLIISEVINAMLRIAFKTYKENLPHDPSNRLSKPQILKLDFKKDYRTTNDYNYHLRNVKEDLRAYLPFVEVLDNKFKPDLDYLVGNFPEDSDFNDFFYYRMARENELTIVTDDGDFNFKSISILSENGALLK